ncbi:MAG: class I SAM-dependent methyltransferase [Elusimicrobia bacterium]|nr:class I SAM-dependent methyltransferase [Elusimicrobiota bacterium]
MSNIDQKTVSSFGCQWTLLNQAALQPFDQEAMFNLYFRLFPWGKLPSESTGFDLGCGTGRWAKSVAPRVGKLYLVDASPGALAVAQANLNGFSNCEFIAASVDDMPFPDKSMDFGYSLGVLHHIPDTLSGLKSCVAKLKEGAPFLLYLYYALENRPLWFRGLWRISDFFRRFFCYLPERVKQPVTFAIALFVYFPLARLAYLVEKFGVDVDAMPLSFYRNRNFYVMRTDSRDRFGTPMEKRFTRNQIEQMMTAAGLERIEFSAPPYWCALGYRKTK